MSDEWKKYKDHDFGFIKYKSGNDSKGSGVAGAFGAIVCILGGIGVIAMISAGSGTTHLSGSQSSGFSPSVQATPNSDSGLPMSVEAQRLGEDARRSAENVYYNHVPGEIRRAAEGVAREAGNAADAAKRFVKGATGR